MTNPVSSIPSAQLPLMDTQIATTAGTPTLLFHRFITGIWQRTGGANGINNNDIAQTATQALTIAQQASQEATTAESTATAAQTVANQALAAAAAAQTGAGTAQSVAQYVQNIAMVKTANLSDVASIPTARSNLGLATYPAVFQFDTCPAALHKGVPLTRSLVVPASLSGCAIWWGIAATGTVTFNVGTSRSPSSAVTNFATIQIVAGTGFSLSTQAAVSLSAGDCLVVTAPGSPDATLAQLSITIPLTLA